MLAWQDSARILVGLQDWGGEVSLARFMALPVEQYYELDPSMIKPLQGNRFALVVPRVHVSPGFAAGCHSEMCTLQQPFWIHHLLRPVLKV